MNQITGEHQKHVTNISEEIATRRHLGMTDAEVMHQIGLSMRAAYDKLPLDQQTGTVQRILQDCAAVVADREIGLDRAVVVARRDRVRSILQDIGEGTP